MAEYRKKPVVIEAIQFVRGNEYEIIEFTKGAATQENCIDCLVIKTLEGEHIASYNDYIIKGVAGEFYPCKPDIFKATYEKVVETK